MDTTRQDLAGPGDESSQELVDAVVAAIDVDRSLEVERLRAAFEPFGLTSAFNDELRMFGVASTTWRCCKFCGDVLTELSADGEVAA